MFNELNLNRKSFNLTNIETDIWTNGNQILFVNFYDIFNYDFPDSDFCLFSNFPHERLVYPIFKTAENYFLKSLTCTFTFLSLFDKAYNTYFNLKQLDFIRFENETAFYEMLKICDLPQMIYNCTRNNTLKTVYSNVVNKLITEYLDQHGGQSTRKHRTSNRLNTLSTQTTWAYTSSDDPLSASCATFFCIFCILTIFVF
jgi:hypothetical protein